MSRLPSASTRLVPQAGAAAASTDLIAVFAPCRLNADGVPRLYSSIATLLATHDYSEGAEYCAHHMQDTKKPVIFVPLAINTPGTIGRFDMSGNTGTSVVTCAAGVNGILAETDGVVSVLKGGTVGTDQILLSVSLDGGAVYKTCRVGTAKTFTIPYVGLVLGLTDGTLNAGDVVLTWHSTAPKADLAGVSNDLMEAQKKTTRSWLFVSDIETLGEAQGVETAANTYETEVERFIYAKAQMRDRRVAKLSQVRARMKPGASVTFAEVGATGDTITRSTGSFVTDGFVAGDTFRVTGSASNNVTGVLASLTATVLTLGTTDLAAEEPTTDASITAEPTLTFAASGHTITRNRGSWIDDGFKVGDSVTTTGTVSNNGTATITALSATVMTFGSGLTDETIGSFGVLITATETAVNWRSSIDSTVASISNSYRLDLGAGRLRGLAPIIGYSMRRPVQWADSIRSYQHDVHITTWWKALGALQGWSIEGEHDERVDEGLIDARFTCARTYANGPDGAFIAKSITRGPDNNALAMTHNVAVADVAQAVIQTETEAWIGATMVLNADGTATADSLAVLNAKVNEGLRKNLLANVAGEGQRASVATWTAATDDILNGSDPTLHGSGDLEVNGTLVHLDTAVGVR